MIRVENIDVWGFEHAIRAMRNPMNSWDKSDSGNGCCKSTNYIKFVLCENCPEECVGNALCDRGNSYYQIGKNDLDLMHRLYKAGTEHRTYARMIQVSMDITAPLYWWKEMDRYTVGKSQVSCSTMHKIAAKEFELDDFSTDHLIGTVSDATNPLKCLDAVIYCLNYYRTQYISTKNKSAWWQMIQLLPSSYNQKRTVCMSYETIFKIIKERTGHKLDEWNEFVKILKDLPYIKEIIDGSET